ELATRPAAAGLLALVLLYKFGNWFSGPLTGVFLVAGLHFTPADVGVVNKGLGIVATIIGVFLGGALMPRLGLFRSLLAFGILQAASTLAFMLLALVGHHYGMMVLAVGIENVAWGMGTAAFVAYLMALCDHRYTAFQFALLSAFDSFSRVFLGPLSGYFVEHAGWAMLFLASALLALPGLMLILALQRRIESLERVAAP
ncbi:MAG TPA: MFS transporter, partial [Gammaproteobacteria bacterium]|nr:MFS transporter [Gammaproteobacteria bacterium]